jgi:NTE family protein
MLRDMRALSLRGPRTGHVPDAPKHAFVLSGGGSAGAAQVGMLRALFEAGVVPSLLVGCSVGALNAAFVALDPTLDRVEELERLWRGLDRKTVFGSGRAQAVTHLLRRDAHLYEPAGLLGIIDRFVPVDDLAKTAVPCHVVTTDLESGLPAFWSAGDPRTVLAASACLPAIFPPVALGGSLHVDGGVTCPLPLGRALELGATHVWALDVSGGSVGRRGERMTALDVLLLSFSISRQLLNTGARAAVATDTRVVRLPEVDLGQLDLRDFSRTPELIDAGYAAARSQLGSVPAPRAGARAG